MIFTEAKDKLTIEFSNDTQEEINFVRAQIKTIIASLQLSNANKNRESGKSFIFDNMIDCRGEKK